MVDYEGIDDEINEKEFMECEEDDNFMIIFSELSKRRRVEEEDGDVILFKNIMIGV